MSHYLKVAFSVTASKVRQTNVLQSRYEAIANLFSLRTSQDYPDTLTVMGVIRDLLKNLPVLGEEELSLLKALEEDIEQFPLNAFVRSTLTDQAGK